MPQFHDDNMPAWRDLPKGEGSSEPLARPCVPEVAVLAEAMLSVGEARDRLDKAKERADRSFYGYSPELVSWEQDDYYRAAERLADAVVAVVAKAGEEVR